MEALLFALVLEVALLQFKILEGTAEIRRELKSCSKAEKSQHDKLVRDRETVKDVIQRTLIEVALTEGWRSLQEAVDALRERSLAALNMRQDNDQLRISFQLSLEELISKRRQWKQELGNADKRVAVLRDKMKDDFQNAKARLGYAEKWLLARYESLELQLHTQTQRAPLPRLDHEQRVHEELLKAYDLQIKEHEEAYEYWKERYRKDIFDINDRVSVKCEQLRATIARREELQSLYKLHEGEMRAWLTFKKERAARLAREARRNNAANLIQAWWRGVMVRHALGQFRNLRSAKKPSAKGKKK